MTIWRQVQEVGGQVVIREATKTVAGMNRKLPLPPRVLAELRAYVLTLGTSLWLFPSEEHKPIRQSNFERSWHGGKDGKKKIDGTVSRTLGIRQKANLPDTATLHGFRYTANNRMMQLGIPPEVRKKIFGWGKKGIEQHYTDADLKSIRQALALAEQTLWEYGTSQANEDARDVG